MTDSAPRPRGRPGTSADTRARLIAAAIEVFLERGYADTRVQDITNAAGFTTGALYAHFGSRMEILAEALLTEGRRLIADMTDQAAHADIEDSNVSRRVAERLTGETRDIDRLMLEAITMATRDEDAREAIVPALVQIGEQLSDLAVLARDRTPYRCCTSPSSWGAPSSGHWTFPGPIPTVSMTSSCGCGAPPLDAPTTHHRVGQPGWLALQT